MLMLFFALDCRNINTTFSWSAWLPPFSAGREPELLPLPGRKLANGIKLVAAQMFSH